VRNRPACCVYCSCVFVRLINSIVRLFCLHLQEGCSDQEGLMCRDRVRCWTRLGRAPWRKRCGRSLCHVSQLSVPYAFVSQAVLDLPVSSFWNASSTLLASKAEVSMKLNPFCTANSRASSVGTARRCLKSLLFPTSMITMFVSAWSRSSFSQRVTFS
jgi:hypothetical protein